MTPMTPLEVVRAARTLFSDSTRWTQGVYARDANGEECSPTSADACKWCYVGAFANILKLEAGQAEDWRREHGLFDPTIVNDDPKTTFEAILAWFDEEEAALTRASSGGTPV